MRNLTRIIGLALLAPTLAWGQAPGRPPLSAPPPLPAELQPVWDRYEDLIKAYPREPLLHYNFGNLAYGTGDFTKALEEYQAALGSDDRQTQAKVMYNLGNSFFRAGKLKEAAAFYRRSLELDASDPDARINYELATRMAEEQAQESKDSPASDDEAEDEQRESSEDGQQRDQEGGQQGEDSDEQQQSAQDEASAGDEAPSQQSESQANPQEAAADSLQREEAEAILNALRANEDNLLKRRYRSQQSTKLEKDW